MRRRISGESTGLLPVAILASFAEFIAGRYEEAAVFSQRSKRENGLYIAAHRMLAASLALAGRVDEAREAARDLVALQPGFRIGEFTKGYPLRRAGDLERLAAALRTAGLPD